MIRRLVVLAVAACAAMVVSPRTALADELTTAAGLGVDRTGDMAASREVTATELRDMAADIDEAIKLAQTAADEAAARAKAAGAKPPKDSDEEILRKAALADEAAAKHALSLAEAAKKALAKDDAANAKKLLDQAKAEIERATVRKRIKAVVKGETDKELDEKFLEMVGNWKDSGGKPPTDDQLRTMAAKNMRVHGNNQPTEAQLSEMMKLLKEMFNNGK